MFYGWRIVAGTFISQMFVVGFFSYSMSLLVPPVQEEFGASLEQVMYSMTAGTFMAMLMMPIGGILVDKFSVRWLITGGLLGAAAGLWSLAQASTIWQFVGLFGLSMAVSNCFSGPLGSSAAVSRWFTRSRGKALGVSAMGTSVGGMALPALLAYWIETSGWRSGLEYLSICILLLAVPITALLIRSWPADVGLQAEAMSSETGEIPDIPITALPVGKIVRMPAYWLIGLSMGLLFAAYGSFLANLTPYAISQGSTSAEASALIMILAVAGLVGKLLFGAAADKISHKVGLWSAHALVCVSFLILISNPSYGLMVLASICLGLAAGGILPVWSAMLAHIFGPASFGRAMGLMAPLNTLIILPSYAGVGKMVDVSGSYNLPLTVLVGLVLLAAILLIPLRTEPQFNQAAD